MLRIVATFTVAAEEIELFSEEEFPIVELAAQLDYWLRRDDGLPFTYDSAESEDVLLSFKPERKVGGLVLPSRNGVRTVSSRSKS